VAKGSAAFVVEGAPPAVPWRPHAYQRRAVSWLVDRGAAALFLDPGLGKTAVALEAFRRLRAAGAAETALVVAPLRVVYSVWPDEVRRWRGFSHLRVEILHGPKKDAALRRDADLYLINPEGLPWLLDAKKGKNPKTGKPMVVCDLDARFARLRADTLVLDELSRFKHGTTNYFKALRYALGTFRRRWGLTGSPAANGLLDLHGQLYVLDAGRSLEPWFAAYRRKYFFPTDPNGWRWLPRAGAAEEIEERLRPIALRMSAADHLDLPDLVEVALKVELPKTARKRYDELEDDFLASVRGRKIVAANAAAASTKLRQLVGGAVYYDEARDADGRRLTERDWVKVHDEKIDALEELVGELNGSPLLVAYEFRHEAERIRKRLGAEIPVASELSMKESTAVVDAWNRGEVPILLGHPKALAHGLNLQRGGSHVAWFTLTWDLELYDQLIRRIWRQGATARRVVVHRIVAKATVDDVVVAALRRKGAGQAALFDGLSELAKERG
jgi:SNF2 family DNA or RNA helicase